MSWLQEGEFEGKLGRFTNLSEQEIAQRAVALDNLHEYLWNQGLRPSKVKREVKLHGRKMLGTVMRRAGDTTSWA